MLAVACSPDSEGPAAEQAVTRPGAATATSTGTKNGAASGSASVPASAPGRSDAEAGQPHVAPAGGWFDDVTAASGLLFRHDAGVSPERQLPETMGAGAALADLDDDGDVDAYLVQSGPLPAPAPGAHPDAARPTNRLFLNELPGVHTPDPAAGPRFSDATEASGAAAHDGYGMGVVVGDVDGDGSLDLYLTNYGPDALLLNDGTARFRDATRSSGLDDARWTGGAALFDADVDGDLDLFVAAYVDLDLAHPAWCGRREEGWRSYCHPDAYPGLQDRFWRNLGAAHFRDATDEAGLVTQEGQHGKGLGVLPTDVDGDLDLDLYVANDSTENRLWINVGGRFEDGTLLSGTGVNGRGETEAGMGLAAGDVDGDGDDEIFVTNFDDESNTLYRNDGEGLFTDITALSGLDAASRLPVGFGTVLSDLDADGDLDIAVTNGHIIDNIALYDDGKTHAQHALLYANDGQGRFADVSQRSGDLAAPAEVGRGLYDADLDDDGDLDLLLTTCNGPARVLANRGGPEGSGGGSVRLLGLPRACRVSATLDDGRQLVRSAGPQPSYFGQTADEVFLGLGGRPGAPRHRIERLDVQLLDGTRLAFVPARPLDGGRWRWRSEAGEVELQNPADGETMPATRTPPDPDRTDKR